MLFTSLFPVVYSLSSLQGLMEVMNYLERVQSAKLTRVLDLAWLGVKNMYLDPDSLTSLTTLNLSGNDFEDLPRQIPLLVGLKTLTFDENRLRLLPPGLGCLTNITKLSFKGNPVESPPEEIIDRGTDAILSFLRKLWIADQVALA
jgi:Leucine-rich repeat (LRR) protein